MRDFELLSEQFLRPGGMFYVPTGITPASVAGDDYTGLQRIHVVYRLVVRTYFVVVVVLRFKKERRRAGPPGPGGTVTTGRVVTKRNRNPQPEGVKG